MTTRADTILATVDDLVSDFVYYDRKDDEDLRLGAIQLAIEAKEITVEEILAQFEESLRKGLGELDMDNLDDEDDLEEEDDEDE